MFKFALAAVALTLAGPAFAAETQPHDRTVKLFAYEQQVDNFCPAGTQPIRYNGVICCGVPNAFGYGDAPAGRPAPRAMAAQSVDPKSPSYAPERIPMGKSPSSMDGS